MSKWQAIRLLLLICVFLPLRSWAQNNEGQVADSTELRVLRQFYSSTGGDQWTTRTNWPTTPAQWQTATLNQASTWYGVGVRDGDIVGLNLQSNNLRGPLPAAFGELRLMQGLYLALNQLTGALPASMAKQTLMNQCSLSSNQFSGELTGLLDQWHNLQSIDLSHNQLTGPVPGVLGSLARLYSFWAANNQLSGPLPKALGKAAGLWGLNLQSNRLTGRVPGSWGQLSSLRQLFLDGNQLTGPLTDSLANMTYLDYLGLSSNQLTGSIPAGFARFNYVYSLNLSSNKLTGSIPENLKAGMLLLQNNQLSGELPASYSTTRNWQILFDNNNITRIPHFAQPLGYPNLQLGLTGNYLQFDSYEPNQVTPGQYQHWDYGQRTPPGDIVVQAVAGETATLDGRIGGDHNRYQWLRLVGGQWVEMPGQTQPMLRWSSLTPADAGTYCTRVTNEWVPNITLYSKRHTLDVLPFLDHLRNLPVDANRGLALVTLPAAADATAATPADINFVRTWVPQVALTSLGAEGADTPIALVNPSFEQEQSNVNLPTGWSVVAGAGTDPNANFTEGNPPAHTGNYHGTHYRPYNPNAYAYFDVYTYQIASNLPAGRYRVGAWVRSNDGHSPSVLRVQNYGGSRREIGLPNQTGPDIVTWTYLEIKDILVTNGQCEIGFYSHALGGQAFFFDDVMLVRQADPTQTGPTAAQTQITTQYLDGLGRPVQLVQHRASPQQRDLVQAQAYDALGREPRQYLPYPADTARVVAANHVGPYGYRYQALNDQQQFYRRITVVGGGQGPLNPEDPTQGVARTGAAFGESVFEASPLNRMRAQGAPGEIWQLSQGHVQERQERPNTEADSVLRFVPGYDPQRLDPGYQGFYAPGELWGTEVADAHGPAEPGAQGYRTIEWKDKLDQVVLKQVEANRTGTGSDTHSRWLRTAYAYDDFRRLRFVLQPEGTRRIVTGAALSALTPFLFHYRYDGQGRQIAKQVPGQDGETLVVYDQLDRPVLTQDAQQRTRREWSWTKYDALGRTVLTGLVSQPDGMDQVSLQAIATADTATAHQYEQRTTNGAYQYYTANQSFPQLGQQGFGAGQVLTATYYDNYDFDNNGTADLAYDPQTDGQFPSGQAPVADMLRAQSLTTCTKTRVLGVAENDPDQAAWLTTTTFYDERARPVQVQTTNVRKGTDLLTTQLDFTGKVVQSVAVHQRPNHTPVQVAEFFTYDHTGRLLTTSQQVLGEAQPTQVAAMQYNEIGQVARKTLGTGRLKQEVDYAYNIRGWLIKLNDPYQPVKEDLFNLSLHYETGFTKGYEQYSGNLTGQTWRGRDGVQRAYGYVYDPLNRLLQGDFVARAGGSQGTLSTAMAWNQELDNYRLSFVSYDDNGNINTLRRRGLLQNATSKRAKQYGAVDNLKYAYVGNRLQAVDDQVTGNQLVKPTTYHGAPTSLAGDFQEASVQLGQEYLYDASGNLTQDKNKGITAIKYNHLNLPRQIQFGTGADSVVFRYTASGQKVAKLVYQTGRTTPERTDYLGPYQYEQDSLKFFPHAEGRVLRFVSKDPAGQTTVSYQREFTLKDHLGNLRLAYRLGQPRTLIATLEQDDNTKKREVQQFDSLSVSLPIAVATPNAMGQYAARLNAGGSTPQPLGPLTQLGVQKGDVVTVSAFGYYPQAPDHGFFFSLASFLTSLFQPAQPAPVGLEAAKRKNLPLLQLGVAAGLTTLTKTSGVPLGYLRVLVFNKDSVLVQEQTKQVQLSSLANKGYQELITQVVLAQDGYVTAYVGNESSVDVYFDNVKVDYQPGLLVQETQYDPAGLELAGLVASSPGIRGLNNYRFNGKEFQADLGLAWNHQDWRFFDPQLLRWHVSDPELENGQESWTPYSFSYGNAVRYEDANGRCPGGCPPARTYLKAVTAQNTMHHLNRATNAASQIMYVKVGGQAAAIGGHVKMGPNVRLVAEGKVYPVEVSASSTGVKAEGNALKGGVSAQLGPYKAGVEGKAGTYSADIDNKGNFSFKRDETLTVSASAGGGNLRGSQSGAVNSDNQFEAGVSLGPLGATLGAQMDKVSEFVGSSYEALKAFVNNVVTDVTNNGLSTDPQGRSQEDYVREEKMR